MSNKYENIFKKEPTCNVNSKYLCADFPFMCLSQDSINNKKKFIKPDFNTSKPDFDTSCVRTMPNNFGAPIEYKMVSEVDSKKISSKIAKIVKK